MEIIDKAANSANEAVDKVASATNQAAEALGKRGEQLKNAEQQLLEDCRVYVREQPHNVGGYRSGGRLSAEPRVERPLDRQTS